MAETIRILILEDNPDDVELAKRQLRKLRRDFVSTVVETEEAFQTALREFKPDIVLADNSLPQYDGMSALEVTKRLAPDVPFVFVSGTLGEEHAIAALQEGASDYVLKQRLLRLRPAVQRALREAEKTREQRRIQRALRETQNQLQSIMDHSPALHSVVDLAGRYVMTNRIFNERLGLAEGEAKGKTMAEVLPPDMVPPCQTQVQTVIERGMPIVEEHVHAFDEAPQTFLAIRFPLRDEAGKISAVCAIDADITEQKAAERALRSQSDLLDHASDAILVLDQQQRFTYCNRAAESLTGWTEADLLENSLFEVFNDITPSQMEVVWRQARDAAGWRGEIMLRKRDGEMRWWNLGVSAVAEADQAVTGHILIGTDITDQKALHEQFLRVQRLENIGMLSAGIAHDLNNVLSPVGMVATLLRSRLSEERDLRMLDTLEKSAERGADLVKQILSFAHGAKGDLRSVQVKHIGRDVAAMIRHTFPKDIVFEEEIPSDLWVVNANPTQIHQVIMNLCVNARDAMPEGGTLRLRMQNCTGECRGKTADTETKADNYICIEVEDTGTGIPEELQDKIFSPFFSTKAAGKGTGLGLSTVRGIVENHQGSIGVESEPGQGAKFSICLPAIPAHHDSRPPFEENAAPRGLGELVLVAEDEVMIRNLLQDALETEGYQVVTAVNGSAAAEIFLARSPEIGLVITDMLMPQYGGDFLIQAVWAIDPSVKVIAITGMDQKEALAKVSVQAKVAAWVRKPFEVAKLMRLVSEFVKRSPATPE